MRLNRRCSERIIETAADGKGRYRGLPRRKPRNWFETAVANAGIQDYPWHSLRHTFASRLVMAGVDLRTVQELLGHRTIQMTCRYAHLAPQHKLEALERLASLAGEQSSTKSRTGDFATPGTSDLGPGQAVVVQLLRGFAGP